MNYKGQSALEYLAVIGAAIIIIAIIMFLFFGVFNSPENISTENPDVMNGEEWKKELNCFINNFCHSQGFDNTYNYSNMIFPYDVFALGEINVFTLECFSWGDGYYDINYEIDGTIVYDINSYVEISPYKSKEFLLKIEVKEYCDDKNE